MKHLNFGRNISLEPRSICAPKSEQEVLEILGQNKGRRIRCVGRLHSWSRILLCNDVLLDLRHLNQVQTYANDHGFFARVGGGCQIKHLLRELQRKGWTLPSVGFITEQTVAGAISTGTHGSGRHSLSHYVTRVRIARYDGDSGKAIIEELATGDALRAARCALGCLGVILSVTMECRPLYRVEEHFRKYDQLDDVIRAEKDYPLQQFYLVPWSWTYIAQHRREVDAPETRTARLYRWYRFIVLDLAMHLLILSVIRIIRFPAAVRALFRWVLPPLVIRRWRVVAVSNTQLVMEHELFRHVEIELFVRRERLHAAIDFLKEALDAVGRKTSKTSEVFFAQLRQSRSEAEFSRLRGTYCHHYPICVRRILPDDTLISMASNASASPSSGSVETPIETHEPTWYSITLTSYQRGARRADFEAIADFLASSMARLFDARPHWGKLCPLSSNELQRLYPAMVRFRQVCNDLDPAGVFGNEWTDSLLHQLTPSIDRRRACASAEEETTVVERSDTSL